MRLEHGLMTEMKDKEVAEKIRSLTPAPNFTVASESERQLVLRTSKTLRAAGVIDFSVITKGISGGGFAVLALADQIKTADA